MDIDDFILLGRAIPVLLKDRRITICAAGFSEKLGLIRIYPTSWKDPIHRWDILSVKVISDRKDSREESWKREKSSKLEVIGSLSNKKREKEELLESIYEES
ncbi:MAG: hypothetical protein HWN65_09475 [Candidatus Helarchaeota archaeon]|nr:hypothetical protein [Candidatus Helarchaeota archaeon]